jgi:hypothetical protein
LLSSLNVADWVVTLPQSIFAKFLQSEGSTRILAAPRLRAAEGKKTTLKIGEDIPIPVTSFTLPTAGTSSFGPATSFQYKTVGITLELTPKISASGDITLDPMTAEFSILGTKQDVGGGLLIPSVFTNNLYLLAFLFGLATFAYAAAALITKQRDWARAARPFMLTAWIALTLGIALGSWWAYYELGWGGFWFWDPVENASLMPWLVATALLHSALATERTGAFRSWTLLLAIAAFSLSLIGTFLVRSGVLSSVHSFANDPERGVFILALIVGAIGGALALFAWRAPSLEGGASFEPTSRETALLLNNVFLAAAAATPAFESVDSLASDVTACASRRVPSELMIPTLVMPELFGSASISARPASGVDIGSRA